MSIISKNISKAIEILSNDDLVAIPTETVYGLAGNIYSEKAIMKIYEMKERPLFNPLIVHLSSIEKVNDVASEFTQSAQKLAEAFWPGPLTMVFKKKSSVPNIVTAGKDTVGIRIPDHPVTLDLLKELPFPLAAPSANPFGCISPTSAAHVEKYFKNSLSMVLDGGHCKSGIESTIIGFEKEVPVIYRLGSITIEEITAVIGPVEIKNKKDIAPDAPGMLSRHYAPKTSSYLVENADYFLSNLTNKKVGVLLFDKAIDAPNIAHSITLSKTGNLKEAASKLYESLHQLDVLNLDLIVIERFPDVGLGKSINDRLERATHK